MYLELLVQFLNVIFHPLNQLCLVLTDGPTDVSPHKQGVVAREDAEHLVGVLGRSQLVPQFGGDSGLHAVDALIVPLQSGLPGSAALGGEV